MLFCSFMKSLLFFSFFLSWFSQVEVFDDLSINRWLMRIMRLGGGFVSNQSPSSLLSSSISSSSPSFQINHHHNHHHHCCRHHYHRDHHRFKSITIIIVTIIIIVNIITILTTTRPVCLVRVSGIFSSREGKALVSRKKVIWMINLFKFL